MDDVGNRTKMDIDGTAYTSADIAYGYDEAYQLTSEVRTGGSAYSQYFYYDASGNRTKKTLGGTDTTYLYNTADQLTSETTGGTTTEYEYDANGALTKSDDGTTVNAYEYDPDGYLTAFDTTGTDNDATYTYDAGKRRIAKTVDSDTIKYFLDGSNVIADYDGSDVLQATYVTPGLDANLSQERGGSTYYYMADGLGSIRNLVDTSEDTQNTYDYYAFGKELGSWTQNVTNRYTYTAREYDEESSQYYYRARYYSGSGRFNRRDPAHQGSNFYTYVRSAPILYRDPSGLKFSRVPGPNGNTIGTMWISGPFADEWGIRAGIHFRLSDLGAAAMKAGCVCDKFRYIQVVDTSHPWPAHAPNPKVDGPPGGTIFYDEPPAPLWGKGITNTMEKIPTVYLHQDEPTDMRMRSILTCRSIGDAPGRDPVAMEHRDLYWYAETCLVCERNPSKQWPKGRDRILTCVKWGYEKDADGEDYGPVRVVGPTFAGEPSGKWKGTVNGWTSPVYKEGKDWEVGW